MGEAPSLLGRKTTKRGQGTDLHIHRVSEAALNTLQVSWLLAN